MKTRALKRFAVAGIVAVVYASIVFLVVHVLVVQGWLGLAASIAHLVVAGCMVSTLAAISARNIRRAEASIPLDIVRPTLSESETMIAWISIVGLWSALSRVRSELIWDALIFGIVTTVVFIGEETFANSQDDGAWSGLLTEPAWWRSPLRRLPSFGLAVGVFTFLGIVDGYLAVEFWLGSPDERPSSHNEAFPIYGTALSLIGYSIARWVKRQRRDSPPAAVRR